VEGGDDDATSTECGLQLSGWEKDDDPVEEHRRRHNTKNPICTQLEAYYKDKAQAEENVEEQATTETNLDVEAETDKRDVDAKASTPPRSKAASPPAEAMPEESSVPATDIEAASPPKDLGPTRSKRPARKPAPKGKPTKKAKTIKHEVTPSDSAAVTPEPVHVEEESNAKAAEEDVGKLQDAKDAENADSNVPVSRKVAVAVSKATLRQSLSNATAKTNLKDLIRTLCNFDPNSIPLDQHSKTMEEWLMGKVPKIEAELRSHLHEVLEQHDLSLVESNS